MILNQIEEFNFEEDVDGRNHDKYLWMNAAWAYATRITDAFAIGHHDAYGYVHYRDAYAWAHDVGTAIDEVDALPNVRVSKRSGWHYASPVGGPPGQGEFLNAAVVVETTVPPLPFLDNLQRIEARHGRQRSERWAARTLDIDLLVYDDEVVETPSLIVPHPRFRDRRFVLEPLSEIAPDWRDPVTGKTVEELLRALTT